MPVYKHVLLATDLAPQAVTVGQKAKEIAEKFGARLSIVHVVEPVPVTSYVYAGAIDMENQIETEAQQELAALARELAIPEKDLHLEIGPPKIKVLELAKRQSVDLIVLGSHGHSGWAILLGSTANAIAHASECDILMVRIEEN